MTGRRWIFCLGMVVALAGCDGDSGPDGNREVVVYTSVDDVFARPVAERFQQETGIEVKLVTDTDDASVAIREGKPVGVVYPDRDGMGTLLIPNAAVLIAGGPNPDPGKRFIDYLLTPGVEEALAVSEAAQMPLRPGVPVPPGFVRLEDIGSMEVDYAELGPRLETLSRGFLKEWAERNAGQ